MNHDSYPDGYIRGILGSVRTIAMVGVSANTSRPSYFAFKYLLERGYRMIPVNPGLAGRELLGQKVHASLSAVPEAVDMVDIFRASQHARAIVEEASNAQTYVSAHLYTDEAIARAVNLGVRSVEHANLIESKTASLMKERGAIACPTLVTYEALKNEGAALGLPATSVAKIDDVLAKTARHAKLAAENDARTRAA